MSEEKMYMVKNDKGQYWDFLYSYYFLPLDKSDSPTTTIKKQAERVADDNGGHVVTLIEEPEKVVLTKEQAKIVDEAHGFYLPAILISQKSGYEGEEELLMNAYVNGYTVAKEKKYNVKVPHTKNVWYYNDSQEYLQTICPANKKLRGEFTEAEIEHYGLQDCDKVECDNDEQ